MADHTPGPWEYRNASRIYADGVEIAQVSVLSLKQMRANARLIAAAPEMLAMLIEIDLACDGMGGFEPDALKALIEKARGQE